jgi:putative transcriptional regulator
MKDELFDDLVGSIKEAGAYLRGEQTPGSVTFASEPDPRAIRERFGLTQDQFAAALCISVKTLRNWEQGRREPSGPAMRCSR